jgi:Polysaccharide lyase family 4, domain II
MEAFVAVLPTPYYAVTKADGSYAIANVPDGSYTLKVWHPKLKGSEKPVSVHGATQADFQIAR